MEINTIIKEFPHLKHDKLKNLLYGTIEVYPGDIYDIKIKLGNFPLILPQVYETGERIPYKNSRHLYEDGSLCIATPLIMKHLLKNTVHDIYDYVTKLIVPFLKNNSYYELTGKYSFGEYSHNIVQATFESLEELLNIRDRENIVKLLLNFFDHQKITPNQKCYCGSKIKIKKCKDHLKRYKAFKALGRSNLYMTIGILMNNL